ncbi:MAG: hypothetical protein WAW11_05040 [Patescibacteria group bacterium]
MKAFVLVFWVLIGSNVLSQEPYRYLEVAVDNGAAWVRIRPEPIADKTWLENDCIKTVSFRQFVAAEPVITQPEGFYLVEELERWGRVSKNLHQNSFLNQASAESVRILAIHLSRQLFGEEICNLQRDKFFMLWLSLTRAVIKTNNRGMCLDSKDKAIQVALTGEWVWNVIIRSWTVQDVKVFALHSPNIYSVNLIVDAGANIMTKVMIYPELNYEKKFSYDLVDKSSKNLMKKFVASK